MSLLGQAKVNAWFPKQTNVGRGELLAKICRECQVDRAAGLAIIREEEREQVFKRMIRKPSVQINRELFALDFKEKTG